MNYKQALLSRIDFLDNLGIGVIAVRGIGNTIEEAKRPLNHSLDIIGSYESPDIEALNKNTRELVESGKAHAIGLLLAPRYVAIDIDFYKVPKEYQQDILNLINLAVEETFVERSARGGYHIVFKLDENYIGKNFFSKYPQFIDVKYRGYIITYPSKITAGGFVYPYKKISTVDLDMVSYVSLWETILQNFVSLIGNSLKTVTTPTGLQYHIQPDPAVVEAFSKIQDTDILKKFLMEYARQLGCPGFSEAMRQWGESGVIPIQKFEVSYSIPRGSHFAVEMEIFSILHNLGVTPETIRKLSEEIKYPDGPGSSHPLQTYAYTVAKGKYRGALGFCPFMQLGLCSCAYTPFVKMKKKDSRGILALKVLKTISKT